MKAILLVAALAAGAFLAACDQPQVPEGSLAPSTSLSPTMTPAANVPGDPNTGRRLFLSAGCAGCHTVNGLPGATGVAGPNLTNVTVRPYIAGTQIPNTPQTMVRWLMNPQAVKPGAAMPNVGLTEAQARDLAAFLYSLPETASG